MTPLPTTDVGAGLDLMLDCSRGDTTVRLAGDMDIATAGRLVTVVRALRPADLRHVGVETSKLTFIDASGLSALLEVRTYLADHGGRLTLDSVSPALHRVLPLTHLADEFDIRDDTATADGTGRG